MGASSEIRVARRRRVNTVVIRQSTHLNVDLDRFVTEFDRCEFRHCDELFAGINSGAITLHSVGDTTTSSTTELLRTFRRRLRRLDRELKSTESDRTRSIRDDTAILCDRLRKHQTDRCELWIFRYNGSGTICVYVGDKSREVLGCVSGNVPFEAQAGDNGDPTEEDG